MNASAVLPEIVPGVFMLRDAPSWGAPRSRRTGYAVTLPHAGVLALIDPPPLTHDECTQLEALGPPTHILLTVNWHLRGAEELRRRWGCPILIPQPGVSTAETTVDGTFRLGDRLWDSIEVVQHITEFGWPEEMALLIRTVRHGHPARRVLFIGDALCGGREDIGLPDGEVGQYTLMGRDPEQIRQFIRDLPAARSALERLLRNDFDALALGHGAPVLAEPHAALRRFMGRDDVWKAP